MAPQQAQKQRPESTWNDTSKPGEWWILHRPFGGHAILRALGGGLFIDPRTYAVEHAVRFVGGARTDELPFGWLSHE